MIVFRPSTLLFACIFAVILGLVAALSFSLTRREQITSFNLDYVSQDFSSLRPFTGIGGLSGGGATSRLLIDYEEPYRSQILDYLFLPNFGASLHILKVEIGGDCQTTDGTESSHMHSENDLNYTRGYEWWLMQEAKKRNPKIKIYGLSWGVPGWIGSYFSQNNLNYQIAWVKGAEHFYGIQVDYIGIWNERDYNSTYIKMLRQQLNENGFNHTQIVAPDGGWEPLTSDVLADPELSASIAVIGAHYPGTYGPDKAAQITDQLFWASEDYSTYEKSNGTGTGTGCWARILNQNFVNGNMSTTISWNLVSAYYPGLPFMGNGLLWSVSPWSGNYIVSPTIWTSAHTTQFIQPGWRYLFGEKLISGGSIVSLTDGAPTNPALSIIIEKISYPNALCIRPSLAFYETAPETVTFTLSGEFASINSLHMWKSKIAGDNQFYFVQQPSLQASSSGSFSLEIGPDEVVSLTTTTGQSKGAHPAPPADAPFPLPYSDDMESYPDEQEAKYFADQTGTFAITTEANNNKVLRQVVTEPPLAWCGESRSPVSLIGDVRLKECSVSIDALIEDGASDSAYAAVGCRVVQGGCTDSYSNGYFLVIEKSGSWNIYAGDTVLQQGSGLNFADGAFHTVSLSVSNQSLSGSFDGTSLFSNVNDPSNSFTAGWAAIGSSFDYVQFDNFKLDGDISTTPGCGPGDNLVTFPCVNDPTQQWTLNFTTPNTPISYVRPSDGQRFCLNADTSAGSVDVATCDSSSGQQWSFASTTGTLSPASDSSFCLDLKSGDVGNCAVVGIYQCNYNINQNWEFDPTQNALITPVDGYCLTVAR